MVAYSFQKQFVTRIQVGLGQIEHIPGTEFVPKRQTIRAFGKRRHARVADVLQLYYGMRTKQCFSIGVARCTAVSEIRIFINESRIVIPERPPESRTIEKPAALDEFASSDGFADWAAMQEFWKEEHGETVRLGPFVGLLIEWEPIR